MLKVHLAGLTYGLRLPAAAVRSYVPPGGPRRVNGVTGSRPTRSLLQRHADSCGRVAGQRSGQEHESFIDELIHEGCTVIRSRLPERGLIPAPTRPGVTEVCIRSETGYSVTFPLVVIRPIWLAPENSANHRAPSGPAVMLAWGASVLPRTWHTRRTAA